MPFSLGDAPHGNRRIDAFGHRGPAAQRLRDALALAERAPQRHVARLRTAAGQNEIAETRQPDQRFGPRAQRLAEAAQLGKAAGDEGCVRAGTQALAVDDAGGDRQHVLERAAELDAGEVARPVEAQLRLPRRSASSRPIASSAQAMVSAVGRPRATSVAKLGPDSTARVASGTTSATTSPIRRPVACSMPLEHTTIGWPGRTCALRSSADGAHVLRRARPSGRHRRPPPRRASRLRGSPASSATPGKEGVVDVARVDAGDDLGLARPQHDLAAGAAQRLRERRAPGPAADDADAVDLQENRPPALNSQRPSLA